MVSLSLNYIVLYSSALFIDTMPLSVTAN